MGRARTRSIFAVVVLMAACGKGKGKDEDEGKDKPAQPAAAGSAAVAPTPTPPPTPPPPPRPTVVMPADVPADRPLSVAELDRIVQQFPEKGSFTFVGYPAFFLGDSEDLRTTIDLAATAEQKSDAALVTCGLATSEAGKHVDNKTPVTVKGTLRGVWTGKHEMMWFEECTVLGQGTAAKPEALPLVGSAEPVAVDKLSAAYMGWKGKEVTVTGTYFGTTISRRTEAQGGAIIDVRLDLLTATGEMTPQVGCHLPLEQPSAELDARLEKHRAALTVRGTLEEGLARGAQLDPCTVVSP